MDKALTDTLNQIVGSNAVFVLTQITVGLGILFAIDKLSKLFEEKLPDAKKAGIARWLRTRNVETAIIADEAVNWPETFANLFDRVFGSRHLSWQSFWRCSLACYGFMYVTLLLVLLLTGSLRDLIHMFVGHPWRVREFLGNYVILPLVLQAVPDYVSLLLGRSIVAVMVRSGSSIVHIMLVAVDLLVSLMVGVAQIALFHLAIYELARLHSTPPYTFVDDLTISLTDLYWGGSRRAALLTFMVPALFTCFCLTLYAIAGFLLKAAQRVELCFEWFNRNLDIEKHPLSCIGLVAGSLLAVVYWALAVSRVIG